MPEPRKSSQNRETAETRISAELIVDGSGESSIDTGIPFLDHMLTLFARHSLCDLKISAIGLTQPTPPISVDDDAGARVL